MIIEVLDLSNYVLNPLCLPVLLTGLALFFIGVTVLITERNLALGFSFFLMTFLGAWWLFTFSVMYCALKSNVALWWAKAGYLGLPFISSAVYFFSLRVLELYSRFKKILWISWTISFLFAVAVFSSDLLIQRVHYYWWGYYPVYGRLGVPFLLFSVAILILSLFHYASRYRSATSASDKMRIRSFLIAFSIAYLAFVDYLPKFGISVYPWGYAAVFVFLAFLVRTIWRYRLVEVKSSEKMIRELTRSTLAWVFLTFMAFFCIGALGLYAFHVASYTVKRLVHVHNQSSAVEMASVIHHDLNQHTHIAQSLSTLPGFIRAFREKDEQKIRARLKGFINAYPEMERIFVTDIRGVIWSDYPFAPEVTGKDFSHRLWFQSLTQDGKPYISEVYQRYAQPPFLVIEIAVPVRDQEELLGSIVCQYRLEVISAWLKPLHRSDNFLFVIDHIGSLVTHPKVDLQARIYDDYAKVPQFQRAVQGKPVVGEYVDPMEKKKMVASFIPFTVGKNTWVVVAQQSLDQAYAPIRNLAVYLGCGAGILAFIALIVVTTSARFFEKHRRLNELFSFIVESSNDAIISKTPDGTIVTWNRGAERIYGYTAEKIINQNISILVPPDHHDELPEILERLKSGENIVRYNTERVRKDGQRIYVTLTISAIRDKTGQVTGASVTAKDITDQVRADEILRLKNQELEALTKKLQEKTEKLERFHNLTVDRELQMKKIKQEVNTLLEQLGQTSKYNGS